MYTTVKIVREIVRVVPDLSERIKKARMTDGRSAQTLATLCGFSTAYWYQLEAGKRESVNETIIRNMERVMGVDLGLPPFEPQSNEKTQPPSAPKSKRGKGDD